MKLFVKILAIGVILSASACYPTRVVYRDPPPPPPQQYTQAPAQPTTPVQYSEAPAQPATPVQYSDQSSSYQTFYDNLSPYGQWINSPEYGYVWRPDVDADGNFQPYGTNGYWEMTNYGWTWNSNYQWGWAAFHYGRWILDPMYGWMWMPGSTWGPAWVSWRQSGDYYGWAPMGPNMEVDVNYENGYNIPSNYWVFVNRRDLCNHDIYNYYAPRGNYETIYHNSRFINNRTNGSTINHNDNHYYPAGPRVTEVEAATGRPVTPLVISQGNHPNEGSSINNGHMNIYRPTIVQPKENNTSGVHTPTPRKITPMSNLKPISHPNNNNQPERQNNVEPQRPNNNQPERPNNVEPQRTNNNQPERPNNVEPQKPNSNHSERPNNVEPQRPNNNQPKKQNKMQPQHPKKVHTQQPSRTNKVPQQNKQPAKPVKPKAAPKVQEQRKAAPERVNR